MLLHCTLRINLTFITIASVKIQLFYLRLVRNNFKKRRIITDKEHLKLSLKRFQNIYQKRSRKLILEYSKDSELKRNPST